MIKFGKHYYATFHFKSGNRISLNCDDVKITKKETIQSYTIVGVKPGAAFYFDINEIEAVTFVKKFGFWSK